MNPRRGLGAAPHGDQRVVVVIGGAGIVGSAVAAAVCDAGDRVVLADLSLAKAQAAATIINRRNGLRNASALAVDITSRASVQRLLDRTHAAGRIDGIVNSAYPRTRNYGRKFEDVEYADFCRALDAHLGGYFLVAQRAAEHFRRHNGGVIVQLASIYGVMAPRFEIYRGTRMTMPVEYAAIKAGIVHLTRYIARYYKGYGIRINAVSPGGITSDQPPTFRKQYNKSGLTKGLLSPQDVVGAVMFLLSPQAAAVNGQNFIVDDGFSL